MVGLPIWFLWGERTMGLGFVYVCDQEHFARLIISLESLRLFRRSQVFVVDYGLQPASRDKLEAVYGVTMVDAAFRWTRAPSGRRIGAFREKTIAAGRVAEQRWPDTSPIVLIDSDIIILDLGFWEIEECVTANRICMTHSAWDKDFTWTYTENALPSLRNISGIEDFEMNWKIPNSGVVCAASAAWQAVCPLWRELYDRFIALPDWPSVVRAHATPGDQEFLVLAMHLAGIDWHRLHGSYNMQVSRERMAWCEYFSLPLHGGHFSELPERVRAIHFGVDECCELHLSDSMLANDAARQAVTGFVEGLKRSALASGVLGVDG
jgi:hypothetical protein